MDILNRYEDNKTVRTLIHLIPGGVGSAIDANLDLRIKELKEKKLQTFFDQLHDQLSEFPLDLIDSDDFLHCYFITVRSVLSARREDKIKLFADLISSAIFKDFFKEVDEYEEMISVLDDLSYREIMVLNILSTFEKKHPFKPEKSKINVIESYWDRFKTAVETTLNINKEDVSSVIMRITRSGFLTPYMAESNPAPETKMVFGKPIKMSGGIINTGEPIYRLNSFYYKFKGLVRVESEEDSY